MQTSTQVGLFANKSSFLPASPGALICLRYVYGPSCHTKWQAFIAFILTTSVLQMENWATHRKMRSHRKSVMVSQLPAYCCHHFILWGFVWSQPKWSSRRLSSPELPHSVHSACHLLNVQPFGFFKYKYKISLQTLTILVRGTTLGQTTGRRLPVMVFVLDRTL